MIGMIIFATIDYIVFISLYSWLVYLVEKEGKMIYARPPPE